jgi:hypothetical protein
VHCLLVGRLVEEIVREGRDEPSFTGIGLSRFS